MVTKKRILPNQALDPAPTLRHAPRVSHVREDLR